MGSKLIALLGLFLAMAFFISSQVAATKLEEAEETYEATVNGAKYAEVGYGKYSGGGYGGGYPGQGGYGGGYGGGYPGHGGGYGGGYGGKCNYGCCRCCSYASEKADSEHQAKPKN